LLVQQGYGLSLIGRVLNHSQVSTTQRYAHLDDTSVRAALESTAALVNGKPDTDSTER